MSDAQGEREHADTARRRRRIVLSTVVLALVAVGFYVSIFWAVSHRH